MSAQDGLILAGTGAAVLTIVLGPALGGCGGCSKPDLEQKIEQTEESQKNKETIKITRDEDKYILQIQTPEKTIDYEIQKGAILYIEQIINKETRKYKFSEQDQKKISEELKYAICLETISKLINKTALETADFTREEEGIKKIIEDYLTKEGYKTITESTKKSFEPSKSQRFREENRQTNLVLKQNNNITNNQRYCGNRNFRM